jgi:hypothetical protein
MISSLKVAVALSLVAFAVLLLGCDSHVEAPPRLSSIPSEAVWVGGVDGGAWIWCEEANALNFCTVYNESTGEVWRRGHFVVEGSDQGAATQELHYDYFDGEHIGLADGRVLVPAEKSQVEMAH